MGCEGPPTGPLPGPGGGPIEPFIYCVGGRGPRCGCPGCSSVWSGDDVGGGGPPFIAGGKLPGE